MSHICIFRCQQEQTNDIQSRRIHGVTFLMCFIYWCYDCFERDDKHMFDSINRQKERVSDFVRRLKTIAATVW